MDTALTVFIVTVGKRSVREEPLSDAKDFKPDLLPQKSDPVTFEWGEHGHRFRRQAFSNTRECHPDGTQHILFMLDTSGSIGATNFHTMTSQLGLLVRLVCKPVKIAVVTFNHNYHVEFCFNCFDNTCTGRLSTYIAMSNITYQGGWTHTGGAAKCACDVILNETCGVDRTASCIDVVLITDGHSNDPSREVCREIQCLHTRFGVNTYAIGIGNRVNQAELNCIHNTSNVMSIFSYNSFNYFSTSLNETIKRLNSTTNYTCIDPHTEIGVESCLTNFYT